MGLDLSFISGYESISGLEAKDGFILLNIRWFYSFAHIAK